MVCKRFSLLISLGSTHLESFTDKIENKTSKFSDVEDEAPF